MWQYMSSNYRPISVLPICSKILGLKRLGTSKYVTDIISKCMSVSLVFVDNIQRENPLKKSEKFTLSKS